MTLTLWIVGMLLSFIMTAYLFKKIEIGKMLIVGSDIYFSLYVISAGILIFRDKFSIDTSLIIVLVAEIIITVMYVTLNGFFIPKFRPVILKYVPIIIVLIIAGFISASHTSEVYGTGQDEGLYQIRAWYYMTGENGNVLDFSEYYNIESDVEKKEYIQYINTMVGYYRLTDDDINDEKTSLAKGVTHGILTFPALLGLWSKMFGIHNMNGILTFMFLLSIGNVWLICNNLKLKKYMSVLAAMVMTICPILIWSSRNVLTEIVLSMFISAFLLLITENKKADKGVLSAIPVCAACFYHVTITIVIPMIVVIYLLMVFASRKAGYAIGLVISMIGYVTGFFMMWSSSHAYTSSSFEQIFKMTDDMINGDNIGTWIVVAASIAGVLGLQLAIKPIRMGITNGFYRMQKSAKGRNVFGIVFSAITVIILAFSIYKMIKVYTQDMRVVNTGFMCYLVATAFVFMPAAFVGIILNFKKLAKNKDYIAVYFAFLYVVFMYCDFMWVLVYRYFYYARYFSPYVCIVVVAGAIMLNKIDFRIVIPVVVICGGIVIWQTSILYSERDLTTFDYEVLESIASCVSDKDAVICLDQGYGVQAPFALPVRSATGADIYFAQDYDLIEKIEFYEGYYQDVYVLLYDVGHYTDEDGKWRYVYRTNLEASYYDDYIDEGLPYPKEIIEVNSPFALIVYEGDDEE